MKFSLLEEIGLKSLADKENSLLARQVPPPTAKSNIANLRESDV
jgi:hypothetical protein